MEIVLPSGSIKRDGGHQQRSNYEKSSARKKGCLDSYPFFRLPRKSTVEQSQVGFELAASAVGRPRDTNDVRYSTTNGDGTNYNHRGDGRWPMSDLPTGFCEWLLEQDPETVPFRSHVDPAELVAMYERAENIVGENQ